MIIDRYDDYDYHEDERLYSTGYDELDNLLEKAFCEGYEYAQKEFSKKKEKKRDKKDEIANNLMIAGGTGLVSGSSMLGGKKLHENISEKQKKSFFKNKDELTKQFEEAANKTAEKTKNLNSRDFESGLDKLYKKYKKKQKRLEDDFYDRIFNDEKRSARLGKAGKIATLASIPVLGTGIGMAVHNKKKQNKNKEK